MCSSLHVGEIMACMATLSSTVMYDIDDGGVVPDEGGLLGIEQGLFLLRSETAPPSHFLRSVSRLPVTEACSSTMALFATAACLAACCAAEAATYLAACAAANRALSAPR